MDTLEKNGGEFVPGLHSTGDLDPKKRFILHFPEEQLIWSIGSGYGGNALLGKKCLSLRLASWMGWKEGWMAEHMLILGLRRPLRQCDLHGGRLPQRLRQDEPGDAGLAAGRARLAASGRSATTSPGCASARTGGSGRSTRRTASSASRPARTSRRIPTRWPRSRRNSIFTNVGLTPDKLPWWEGIDPGVKTPPPGTINWLGHAVEAGRRGRWRIPTRASPRQPAQCPSISPHWEDPQGVPISAFIFGGRRARVAPLVYQAFNWQHGVFVGAGMASETTAAATGKVGVMRRDPMAMLPFCGYNMGDYWRPLAGDGREAGSARRRSSTSTGSARTRTGTSSGRASARTCAR